MWQRIQTVFILIVIVSCIAAIFLPVWGLVSTTENKTMFPYALNYSITENGVITTLYVPYAITGILLVAAATVAFIQIGKYKNRILQVKLGALNSVLLALSLCSAVYFGQKLIQEYGGSYSFGLWLPAVATLCNWVALRFIRRDEKLVRDSDRLR